MTGREHVHEAGAIAASGLAGGVSGLERIVPEAGQESVWDYPRPAMAQTVDSHLRVMFSGRVIAETRRGARTIETSHPPTYYFPREDVDMACLVPSRRRSLCEWKGQAVYFSVACGGKVAADAAWSYPSPSAAFAEIAGSIAFYPAAMEACFVDGEKVQPQPASFYGGWVTSRVVGPFKGPPGTEFW